MDGETLGSDVYFDSSYTAASPFLWMGFTWYISVILICLCFQVTVHNWIELLHFIQFDNFCVLAAVFRPFRFHVIIDKVKVKSTISLFVFYLFPLCSFFPLLDYLSIFLGFPFLSTVSLSYIYLLALFLWLWDYKMQRQHHILRSGKILPFRASCKNLAPLSSSCLAVEAPAALPDECSALWLWCFLESHLVVPVRKPLW